MNQHQDKPDDCDCFVCDGLRVYTTVDYRKRLCPGCGGTGLVSEETRNEQIQENSQFGVGA